MSSRPQSRDQYKKHLERLGDACAFCSMSKELQISEHQYWVLVYAAFPYRKYHSLLISKRHVISLAELEADELTELATVTSEIHKMYRVSGVVAEDSPFGNQLFFSWRSRDEFEETRKAVSHFHVHIYPEDGKEIAIVLDTQAWDIDMNKLKTVVE